MIGVLLPFCASLTAAQRTLDAAARASLDAFGETGHAPCGYAFTRADLNLPLRTGASARGRARIRIRFRPAGIAGFAEALDDDGRPL